MRYLVLATDFDGTLAEDGVVPCEIISALENCRASGRHLLMVTGRELTELKVVFPHLHLFDFVVVENGATLYNPQTDEEQALADPPSPEFVRALQSRRVSPLSVGQVIVATCTPHENDVLEVIRDLGLEMQVIFNKGAVMVLPSGVNKATGLKTALSLLKISPHNVVSVGDGENDHALLTFSELGVAVSNAVPMLAERADWVTKGARGDGVVELIESLIKTDFRGLESRLRRHDIPLAHSAGQVAINIPPYETKMEMLGVQSLNDWTEVAEFGGRIAVQGYQLCVILPDAERAELFRSLIPNSSVITGKVSDGVSILKDIKSHLIFDVAQISSGNRDFNSGTAARDKRSSQRSGSPALDSDVRTGAHPARARRVEDRTGPALFHPSRIFSNDLAGSRRNPAGHAVLRLLQPRCQPGFSAGHHTSKRRSIPFSAGSGAKRLTPHILVAGDE